MFIRMLSGGYAGEIREVRFDAARDLITSGRAERVSYEPESTPAVHDIAAAGRIPPPAVPMKSPAKKVEKNGRTRR
jgi:hypothetical protein